ncbi:MAG TPA: response regulator transcription factor [Oculatellaceae cyanobacterium]
MGDFETIKILIVDHRAVVGTGVCAVLGAYADLEVVGRAESGEETLRLMEQYDPDIVAIDIDLPGHINGTEIIGLLQDKFPKTRVLVLTNLLEEMIIYDALRAGVIGYLLKTSSVEELAHAIRAAYQGIPTLSPEVTQLVMRELSAPISGGRNLSPREIQVLKLIARGLKNHEIAEDLFISLSTVQFHVSKILQKLQVRNRIEAAAFAVRNRLARDLDK